MEEQYESYKKEIDLEDHASPISMEQMEYILKQMKKSVYKIKCNIGTASGFLCLIPFPTKLNLLPTLITNNHVLSEKDIAINQKIQCLLKDDSEIKAIIMDENRKKYTSEKYDTTIIEIKPKDDNININSFLEIDEGIYEDNLNQNYKNKSIYALHYPKSGKIKVSIGTIKYINEKNYNIAHLCTTFGGSSGGPLLNLNNYKVIGVHKGGIEKDKINTGTLIKEPIEEFYNNINNIKKEKKDIEEKIIENEKFYKSTEIREEMNEITIIYTNNKKQFKKSSDYSKKNFTKKINEKISKNKIFGEKFVENNKNKCKMIINEKEEELCSYYNIEKIEKKVLKIKLKGINNINDMSYMFCGCESLLSIIGFDNWNTYNINDMSYLFYQCSSLVDISDISKWKTNNVKDMSFMFLGCSSLINIPDISKWNIDKVNHIGCIFYGCSSLTNIPDISKWNTNNVTNMGCIFDGCSSLTNIPDISKWNTNNVTNMNGLFYGCSSLTNIPDISKWNTNNVTDMDDMFYGCNHNLNIPSKFRNSICLIF